MSNRGVNCAYGIHEFEEHISGTKECSCCGLLICPVCYGEHFKGECPEYKNTPEWEKVENDITLVGKTSEKGDSLQGQYHKDIRLV